jgi:cell division protein FtsQ
MMDENALHFKRMSASAVIVKAYIYDDLYCEGTPSNIRDNMGNVKQLMEELYQEEVTRGVIKVGRDNYISFSPRID